MDLYQTNNSTSSSNSTTSNTSSSTSSSTSPSSSSTYAVPKSAKANDSQKRHRRSPSSSSSSSASSSSSSSSSSSAGSRSPTKRRNYKALIAGHFDVITVDEVHRAGAVFQALDRTAERHLHCVYVAERGSVLAHAQRLDYDLTLSMPAHRHIVKYRACHENRHAHSNVQLLTAEYCVKGTARTLLERTSNGLPLGQAMRLIRSLLQALTHAHNNGVAHANVTLENMAISTSGSLRLRGFTNGFLHISQQSRKHSEYTPPEHGHETSTGTDDALFLKDSWAAGVVLLQLLCRLAKRGDGCKFAPVGLNGPVALDVKAMILSNDSLKYLPPLCKLLLCSLLDVDPDKRLRCDEALTLCERAMKQL